MGEGQQRERRGSRREREGGKDRRGEERRGGKGREREGKHGEEMGREERSGCGVGELGKLAWTLGRIFLKLLRRHARHWFSALTAPASSGGLVQTDRCFRLRVSDSSLGGGGELVFLTNQLPGVPVSPGSTVFTAG